MFNTTGNNFGAGVIAFKDVQESNYIVLNAKFTCSPQSAEYQAAEVLEIKVPALSIARSTIAGVVARYKERGISYGYPYIYDGGTVLKSWVKDANTLCIEKIKSPRNKPPQKIAFTPLQGRSFFFLLANKLHLNLFLLCEMPKFAHT